MISFRSMSLLLVVSMLFLSTSSYAQTDSISIRFISNCGLHISDGTADIYVDFPYRSGAFNYSEFDASEIDAIQDSSILLFTHTHGDHYSRKNVRRVVNEKNAVRYGKWNIDELTNLENELSDFSIKAIKNKHQFSFSHFSYLITWHGKRIFLAGDAESTASVLNETNLDWAFIPIWILMSVMEEEATIDSKMIGIYHVGPNDDIDIIHPTIKVFDVQGEVVQISD